MEDPGCSTSHTEPIRCAVTIKRMDLQAAQGQECQWGWSITSGGYSMLAVWSVHLAVKDPSLDPYMLAAATEILAVSPIGVMMFRLEFPAFINMYVEHSTPRNSSARKLWSTMRTANLTGPTLDSCLGLYEISWLYN